MNLSKAEEQLMDYIWMSEKAFLKDLIRQYPDPKPAVTTVATLLKRMTDKGFVGYNEYGKSREYYALIKKENYFSKHMKNMIQQFFNNSAMQFASFFTKETELSEKELEELRDIINQQLKKKKDE